MISMIFLAASLVMLWFVILSGLTATSPLRQSYFLRADTNGITGARPISQWTYFFICGEGNTDCGSAHPALPLGSAWAGNPRNAPAELVGGYGGATTSFTYWYLWRFGTVFFLITLFFETIAFFAGFLACCSRLGSAVSGAVALTALLFHTVSVSLMTYVATPLPIPFAQSLLRKKKRLTESYAVPPLSRCAMPSPLTAATPRWEPTLLVSAGVPGRLCSSAPSCSASAGTAARQTGPRRDGLGVAVGRAPTAATRMTVVG